MSILILVHICSLVLIVVPYWIFPFLSLRCRSNFLLPTSIEYRYCYSYLSIVICSYCTIVLYRIVSYCIILCITCIRVVDCCLLLYQMAATNCCYCHCYCVFMDVIVGRCAIVVVVVVFVLLLYVPSMIIIISIISGIIIGVIPSVLFNCDLSPPQNIFLLSPAVSWIVESILNLILMQPLVVSRVVSNLVSITPNSILILGLLKQYILPFSSYYYYYYFDHRILT